MLNRKLLNPLALLVLLGACAAPAVRPTAAPTVPTVAAQASPRPGAAAPASPMPTLRPTATPASPTPTPRPTATPAPLARQFGYPIGQAGRVAGDGFFIRHTVLAENTWYNPGYWHTGEDWYALEGDTAGAQVYAAAAGEVVYAGANYPGRVVILAHAEGLLSMYGHLDPGLAVALGQQVALGELLGTVLRRNDATPNHLHFELRSFLMAREVNGAAPRYPFRCGVNCPPGPGYWPIGAPDLPTEQGWRIPTHVIGRRMFAECRPPGCPGGLGQVVVATQPASPTLTLWAAPPGDGPGQPLGELALAPGARYALLDVWAGPEDSRATSALGYLLWYQLALPDGRSAWAQAAVPSGFETGGDGRPASVYFNFLPTGARLSHRGHREHRV